MEDKSKKKEVEERESLNPDIIKGPQKDKHQNQYGDQDKATRTQ